MEFSNPQVLHKKSPVISKTTTMIQELIHKFNSLSTRSVVKSLPASLGDKTIFFHTFVHREFTG
jgi:hypothetical protein